MLHISWALRWTITLIWATCRSMVAYRMVDLASYNRREDLPLVAVVADFMAQLVASGTADLLEKRD